ncbi:MAG: DNA pilot protein [Microvirus sp.]|nr:MAG: DNA pilot protein [Microvirus sp.]
MAKAESSKDKRKGQYRLQRKGRRLEYQDMMFSMKQAGLNPILASGATPGHMSIGTGDSDISPMLNSAASVAKVGLEAYKANPENEARQSQASLARAQVANTAAETNNRLNEAPNIQQEFNRIQADTNDKNASAALTDQKAITEAANRKYISENTARALAERRLLEQQFNATSGGNFITDPAAYVAHQIENGLGAVGLDEHKVKAGVQNKIDQVKKLINNGSSTAKEAERSLREFGSRAYDFLFNYKSPNAKKR